jgi:hypothetical protein
MTSTSVTPPPLSTPWDAVQAAAQVWMGHNQEDS